VIESTLRTTNNLLERLHASFFFYIMADPDKFLKIGYFLPSAVLVSVAMMFGGLKLWSDAAWTRDAIEKDKGSKGSEAAPWRRRRRPVLVTLSIMIFTHILGIALFFAVNKPWCIENHKVCWNCVTPSTIDILLRSYFRSCSSSSLPCLWYSCLCQRRRQQKAPPSPSYSTPSTSVSPRRSYPSPPSSTSR
jgi:hypothetical protein